MAGITTNLLLLTTQTKLNKPQAALGTAMERLASRQRINSPQAE